MTSAPTHSDSIVLPFAVSSAVGQSLHVSSASSARAQAATVHATTTWATHHIGLPPGFLIAAKFIAAVGRAIATFVTSLRVLRLRLHRTRLGQFKVHASLRS